MRVARSRRRAGPTVKILALCRLLGDSHRFVEKELSWYDHSYHFISKFMPDHVAYHAERVRKG
jgi:S-formylglutathione hydrolase FrmB